MYCTENAAKEKECPLQRIANSFNKMWTGSCRASDCMFWRIVYRETDSNTIGYCGLAGEPNDSLVHKSSKGE